MARRDLFANIALGAAALATFTSAGFMAFDGIHALTTGDYVRPAEGRFAGQLGPWARIVSTIGIDPESIGMKLFFVTFGIAWLVALLSFLFGKKAGWVAMLTFAAGSLWYLVPGTLLSLCIIGLLLVPRVRRIYGQP